MGKEVHMQARIPALLTVLMLLLVSVSQAHWDPTDPAKWVQFPDLEQTGIDVNASYWWTLADDFECTQTGEVTSVHIWGSWLNDYMPDMDPTLVDFILSFHADIPADQSPTGYSMPGDVIWYGTFTSGTYTVQPWAENIREGWMEPPDDYIFPADTVCWQYNFDIPDGSFFQEGMPDNPVVYWLNVKAIPYDGNAFFGWKSSVDHWNDDAVFVQADEPYVGDWFELRYPPGHPWQNQSVDLAFVIVGEPVDDIDWGDAPEITGTPGYPTRSASGGANHIIRGPWLGDASDGPDPEADGQPDPAAMGDDAAGYDDEDGVHIPVLAIGTSAAIQFEVNGTNAYVEGWIDFNQDRIWQGSEQVVTGLYATGMHSVVVTPPASTVPGQTFARFRISTTAGLTPTGPASDGEVEDHEVLIEEDLSKWFQRPDLAPTGIDVDATYPYILADDFLCKTPGRITEIFIWGSWWGDWLPFGESPDAVDFTLSFHSDIPDSESSTQYSMPGDVLWLKNFVPGEFDYVVWADSLEEGWMYPPDDYWFPGDTVCWLYHFYVDPDMAFFQWGTEENPVVYWLDVQAFPHDADAMFGWKTSLDHWNDDAVWGDGAEPYFGPWYELRYPPPHEFAGHSIDLAFRLIMDPESGVPQEHEEMPGLGLFQNVPNPFVGSTIIKYALPSAGYMKLEVYDVTGRLIDVLVDGRQAAGIQSAVWEGKDASGNDMPSGIYFYRLNTAGDSRTMKMLLLK
jgi:hypothetical protein